MKLGDLIERLQEAAESIDDGLDAEVRLMTQQNYPFENSIKGVVTAQEMLEANPDRDDNDDDPINDEDICYIVEGKQLCYGTKLAWYAIN